MSLAPPRSARHVRDDWEALSSLPQATELFDPGKLSDLPDPVGRWLRHSIRPGTPLARCAWLTMHGQIRIGDWRRFTATQVLVPGTGFIWAATARFAGVPVLGYDKYVDGAGEMRWRLGGFVPVMSARGADVSRSAAGRLAGESILVPTAFGSAQWSSGDTGARAKWRIGENDETVDLDIDADGRLRGLLMQRWGNPDGGPHGRHPFGVAVHAERTFGGITVPSVITAGWGWGTERQSEFFRATIVDAEFR